MDNSSYLESKNNISEDRIKPLNNKIEKTNKDEI